MCEQGSTVNINVHVPSKYTKDGKSKQEAIDVDSCIAELVTRLNGIGLYTVASCCGHGKRPGRISLREGRELFIAKDFYEANEIDRIFNRNGYKPINEV